MTLRINKAAETIPPQAWFGVSAVFHYLGPSFAVLLFPTVGVLGVASMLEPIQIPGGFVGSGMIVDGFVMLGTSALPLLFMLRQPTVKRWHGAVLLLCYLGYLTYLILNPAAPTLAS